MQAIELNAVINDKHEIYLKLPDDITATSAKVIVMYENPSKVISDKKWTDFFAKESVFDDDFLARRN
jgi:hypothetical protein